MTGARRVTIADVAEAAGVSTTAVSWALNDKGTLDPRTRARIRALASELGYRPSVRARHLRSGRSQAIALVSTMPPAIVGGTSRLGFFMEIGMAAARAALDRGYALMLVPPVEDGAFIDRLDVDGALVIEPVLGHWAGERLAARGLPAVAIGRDPTPGGTMAWVDRGASGADVVLGHLADRGCREIAVVVTAQARSTTEDVCAYLRTWAAERGLPAHVARADEHGGARAGHDATLALLREHPSVDAVYAPIDAFAVGALSAARELGRDVPGDLLVATNYDGDRSRSADPPLTALDLRLEGLAERAVALLLDRIEGRAGEAASVPGPAPRLIPRASTAR
ncbi:MULTISPECIES: substrate-binding domain-containing protein [Actinomadura]|uniref:Substrate-binding domain-containing protein n=1 Tax=Actinomadura yumaensis TaxID=111807 RepID=A0ABW2CTK8_9ACTN|nr:substrate-binding domain-containing protein [Actinomadura sp. J1-007]